MNRANYLQHLLAGESPPKDRHCSACSIADGLWRCKNCFGTPSYCTRCCHETHQKLPFHRVERWTGTYYTPAWLVDVGIKINLGHGGLECPCDGHHDIGEADPDISATDDWFFDGEEDDFEDRLILQSFPSEVPMHLDKDRETSMVIVDSSGFHRMVVRWCSCPGRKRPDLQLLEEGLYPTTSKQPQTAFTFQVLDDFLVDNVECKTACLNFHKKLQRLTCAAFPHTVPVCVICYRTVIGPITHCDHFIVTIL